MKTLWCATNNQNEVNKNHRCKYLIVGAGITGLTLNYFLNNEDTIIIDDKIGVTTIRSTGKVTYLQDILLKIEDYRKVDYINSQREAISILKKIIEENNIKCDLKRSESILFTEDEKEIKKLKELATIFKAKANKTKGIFGISVNDTYDFNPGKYLEGLVKISNNKFYKNRYISHTEINGKIHVILDNGFKIVTEKIIFCCNYLPFLFPFMMPAKVRIEKSYLNVLDNEKGNTNSINTKNPFVSERFYKNNKILLNNSHINGTKLDNERLFSIFNLKWTNCDLITYDYLPFVGNIKDNIYIATGYNTWGMTNGTLAAKIIYDSIYGINNKYQDMFDPKRPIKLIPVINNGFINAYLFTKSMFKKKYSFYKKTYVINKNGKRYGVYIDNKGLKHIVYNKCPHMKCNLIFNESEKTWDCPCHASRFDIDGNIIKGPTIKNIKPNYIDFK